MVVLVSMVNISLKQRSKQIVVKVLKLQALQLLFRSLHPHRLLQSRLIVFVPIQGHLDLSESFWLGSHLLGMLFGFWSVHPQAVVKPLEPSIEKEILTQNFR